ncbi:uncharacterized protein K460DRAFT_418323 [Cucurbitaria berberidis CBS 394.84]|uniref:Zn(2)-C6 fungal-type domain-containing protein n=1 Tax=Cucurbitaria berberidis CBS 394.84 TaxID=1168544 RepID=A0A9P4GDH8_9PLEO|nr:uncharacterized protein K460DRAFT_418323 [Cucurbitaria berberidis CBS 394.84]KAF1843220.1 hypothetical protein K460DRAFT_418323 [Cucurbitaria berberidis CBS 394.84]
MPSGTPEKKKIETNDGGAKIIPDAADGLACNGCRKAKLRCSRDRPYCLHCRKTALECVYETKRVKPGLKAGAVDNLHRRLDDLERRINEGESSSPNHEHTRCQRNHTVANDGIGESSARDVLALLAKELPKLVNAPKENINPSTAFSERRSKRKRLDEGLDTFNTAFLNEEPPLPEKQLLEAIVTSYFLHVHPWIPMIHQARFLQRFSNEMDQKQLLVILHAMILAASKFVPGAWAFARDERARKWVLYTSMESLSLENLQALTIVAFNDLGSGNAAKTWSVIGSLTRTVEYTQLAQEQEDSGHGSFCHPYESLPRTDDCTQLEERRRVFWNVFLLDRFCSVTMGWNTSLTSDDVYRRLPCDGHLWRKEKPVLTPYFGIWDKSRGRIGNPIEYVSRYPSPTQFGNDAELHTQARITALEGAISNVSTDMSTVGAFAYNIEATESMSRVMSYFLQQKTNMRDQSEISCWLTRFKELDLRLVHWKMLLPQKWKANPNLTRHVPLMDPNLTMAHVTHNTSMILLHQLIAYPPLHWGFRNRLPSSCSAEACYSAGTEIAAITEKYLGRSPAGSPIGSQYAFCLFIAARILLANWKYTPGNELPSEFWSLIHSLEEMSRRWTAFAEIPLEKHDIFTKYAVRLKQLQRLCATDQAFQMNVMDYTIDIRHDSLTTPADTYPRWSQVLQPAALQEMNLTLPNPPDSADFSTIPQIMLDQDFTGMDRIITFDDGSMFAASFDPGAAAW